MIVQSANGFHPDFERQIMACVITDAAFYTKFRSILENDLFTSDNNTFLLTVIADYFKLYENTPSPSTLRDLIRKSNWRDKGDTLSYLEDLPSKVDTSYVSDNIIEKARWTAIEKAWSNEHKTPRDVADAMQQAANIGKELNNDHTSLHTDIDLKHKLSQKISSPWDCLNELLGGGPSLGDLAVVLSVISGGKTTSLVNVARKAMMAGKNVVYFTFEDGELKIKRRLMQCIVNMTIEEMMQDHKKANSLKNRFLNKYQGNCIIKTLGSNRSRVDDAATFIEGVNKKRPVDVVITDYADRFKAVSRFNEPRHALREIFEDCKRLAMDFNVVHWTARQVNKTRVGQNIIGIEHAGEAWGTMESPDLVIGLGRTLEDERLDRMILYTAKVRDQVCHQRFNLITDFAHQRIRDLL